MRVGPVDGGLRVHGLRRRRAGAGSGAGGARPSPPTPGIAASRSPRERERGLDAEDDHLHAGTFRATLRAGGVAHRRAVDRARALDRRGGGLAPSPGPRGRPARALDARMAGRRRRARVDPPPRAGRRPVRRAAPAGRRARRHDGHRRLSLVRRLGPRHDDRPARPRARHRPPRAGRPRPPHLRALPGPRHAPEPVSRLRARRPSTTPSTRRCGGSRRSAPPTPRPATTRCCKDLFPALEEHRRLAPPRHALRDRRGRRRRARCAPASPACSSPGWTRRVGDWVVTPRIGKPVEINALWYNALRALGRLRAAPGPAGRRAGTPPPTGSREAFDRFWNEAGGYCYDVLDGPDGDDPALRPNQILAVSLPRQPAGARPPAAGRGRLRAPPADLVRPAQPRPVRSRRTAAAVRAASTSGTAPITRARCGRGCSARSPSPTRGSTATPAAARAFLEPLAHHLDDYGVGSHRRGLRRRRALRAPRLHRPGVERGRDAAAPGRRFRRPRRRPPHRGPAARPSRAAASLALSLSRRLEWVF